jgi:hypothetical protein
LLALRVVTIVYRDFFAFCLMYTLWPVDPDSVQKLISSTLP